MNHQPIPMGSPQRRSTRWLGGAIALSLTLTGSLALSSCQQATQTMKDAATTTAQTALAPAVTPVLELLTKGNAEIKGGDLQAAILTMGGFSALWSKAAPVIQPLAGDKWPAIDSAAQMVIKTFAKTSPGQEDASAAITGLLGPLSGLVGQ